MKKFFEQVNQHPTVHTLFNQKSRLDILSKHMRAKSIEDNSEKIQQFVLKTYCYSYRLIQETEKNFENVNQMIHVRKKTTQKIW